MAYYETINLVAGDDKPDINFTLRDSNTAVTGLTLDPDDPTTWAPLDITGAVVSVKFRALGSKTTLDIVTCVNVPPLTAGTCYLVWNPTTLDVDAGTYEGEIDVTYADGSILTIFDRLKFKVREGF